MYRGLRENILKTKVITRRLIAESMIILSHQTIFRTSAVPIDGSQCYFYTSHLKGKIEMLIQKLMK